MSILVEHIISIERGLNYANKVDRFGAALPRRSLMASASRARSLTPRYVYSIPN